jgi:hypothetical protein
MAGSLYLLHFLFPVNTEKTQEVYVGQYDRASYFSLMLTASVDTFQLTYFIFKVEKSIYLNTTT